MGCSATEAARWAHTDVCVPMLPLLPLLPVLQVVAVHGDFDAAIGLDHDEAYRAVMCLRRQ